MVSLCFFMDCVTLRAAACYRLECVTLPSLKSPSLPLSLSPLLSLFPLSPLSFSLSRLYLMVPKLKQHYSLFSCLPVLHQLCKTNFTHGQEAPRAFTRRGGHSNDLNIDAPPQGSQPSPWSTVSGLINRWLCEVVRMCPRQQVRERCRL